MDEISPHFRCKAKNGRTRIRHKALYLEAPRRVDWKSIHKKRREFRLIHEEMRVAKKILATEQAKAAAKEQLAQAMKDLSYDTIPALQAAIQEAELQGLDAVLVDPAKAKLKTTERQLAAKMELQDALGSRTIADLASAISTAESAGLHSDEHLTDARRVHADEKRRVKAQQGLFDAVQSRNIEQLHKAVEEGKACKITEDDIREANDVLMEELRKANAREGLQRATWSCSILDLRSAISEAEDAGLHEEETMEARQMLGIEERKEEARNGLETAVQSRSPEMLQDALEEADRCGLNPKETEMARRVLTEDPSLDEQATASPASSKSEMVTPPATPEALLDEWVQVEVLEIMRDQENRGRAPKGDKRKDWPAIKDEKRPSNHFEYFSDGESHSEYEVAQPAQPGPERKRIKNRKLR